MPYGIGAPSRASVANNVFASEGLGGTAILDLASRLKAQGEDIHELLRAGTGRSGDAPERLAILNLLAAHVVELIQREHWVPRRDKHRQDAVDLFSRADALEPMCQRTWLGKSLFHLLFGEVQNSEYYFQNVIRTDPRSEPALMGLAAIRFHERSYDSARGLFAR